MNYISVDIDVDDIIDELSDRDLVIECNKRGLKLTDDDLVDLNEFIHSNTKVQKKDIQLIMVNNLESLTNKFHLINQFELEEFLNKY